MDRHELHDLEPARLGRELEHDLVADALPHERAANEGAHAHMPLLELDGVAEHEAVRLVRLGLLVLDDDTGSEAYLVGRDLIHVDLGELAQALAELPEPCLHELLAFERGLVLAVLTEVTELHRLPDLGREDDVELVLQ